MNKLLTVLIGILVVVGFGVLIFIFVLKQQNPAAAPAASTTSNTTSDTGTNGTQNVPTTPAQTSTNADNTFSLKTFNGKTILVKDFTKDPSTVADPANKGYYFLGPHPYEGVNDPSASQNPPYIISYSQKDQTFTISLLQTPLGATRQTVEQFLLKSLDIPQSELCVLNYTLTVPSYIDGNYAGTDLGFSFCPGAIQLPVQ